MFIVTKFNCHGLYMSLKFSSLYECVVMSPSAYNDIQNLHSESSWIPCSKQVKDCSCNTNYSKQDMAQHNDLCTEEGGGGLSWKAAHKSE